MTGFAHLDDARIQAFLDGELSDSETSLVRVHAASCVRCQSEIEAWKLLFDELGELPQLDPAISLSERVLEQLPTRVPTGLTTTNWLGTLQPSPRAEHIAAERLQEYVDGELPSNVRGRLEAHVGACEPCRTELAGWTTLFSRLEDLAEFGPSDDFARHVMERVRIRTAHRTAPVGLAARVRRWSAGVRWEDVRALTPSWVRELAPRTRSAWALLASLAAAPTVVLVAVAAVAFSYPLLTPGALASYLWWRATDLSGAIGRAAVDLTLRGSEALRQNALVESMIGSATGLMLVGIGLTALMAASLWIVYRNLFAPRVRTRHARISS